VKGKEWLAQIMKFHFSKDNILEKHEFLIAYLMFDLKIQNSLLFTLYSSRFTAL